LLKKTLSLLYEIGFRQANPGEFTLRAFLNGKMDLTRAEAVNEIIRAKSDKARKLAMHRLSGGIEKIIDSFITRLIDFLSSVEVMIDYPDDAYEHHELDPSLLSVLKTEVANLLASYRAGRLYQEGATVALAGCTNCGKSTLFNLMLKEDRSIVSEFHGTTRDFIEGTITVGGIPIRLYDTAGLRLAEHPVEAEGIRRTARIIGSADVIIYLIDGSQGLTKEDRTFFKKEPESRLLKVWNKSDLNRQQMPEGFIPLCALSGQGLPKLEKALLDLLLGQSPLETDSPVIDSLRQKQHLEIALNALERAEQACKNRISLDLLAEDVKHALDALGKITGEVTSEDLLKAMFAKFCVGK
jgi:tRNA modification GTPase